MRFAAKLAIGLSLSLLTGCFFVPENDDPWDDANRKVREQITLVPVDVQVPDPSLDAETIAKLKQRLEDLTAKSQKENEAAAAVCLKVYGTLPSPDFLPTDVLDLCKGAACVPVPVTLTYLLNQDLSRNQGAVIEAFDNPYFLGIPKASTTLFDFPARGPGLAKTSLFKLTPGEYYVRAYIAQGKPVPYTYESMTLLQNQAIGFYGATTTPKKLLVRSSSADPCPGAISVVMDRYFADPNEEPATGARLRLKLALAPNLPLSAHRKAYIELHQSDDFADKPSARYSLPTESFLIATNLGHAEFTTPQLPLGAYYVFAFIDEDENSFFDEGEMAASLMKATVRVPINLHTNRTDTLNLTLIR